VTIFLLNGEVAETPTTLTDRIIVSVPDIRTTTRQVYGPLPFDPIVSGQGGTRLPQVGDKAVVGIDEGTGEQWLVRWHRDDDTPPPYSETGVVPGSGDKHFAYTQNTAAASWTITHGLGKYPSVTIVDNSGTELLPNVSYIDANSLRVDFSAPVSGKAYLN
jgi:hypothetical protein